MCHILNAFLRLAYIVVILAVSYFGRKHGREKGYSFALCFLLCLLGSFVGIIVLLIPNQLQQDASDSHRNRELNKLSKRIALLERQLAEQTASPEAFAAEEQSLSAAGDALVNSTVRFHFRTEENITCPHCGKRQRGNRNTCYSCGALFQYENEIRQHTHMCQFRRL